MSERPSSWTEAEIGEVCDLLNGRAFKPSDWTDEGLPIVRIQNLNNPEKPFNKYKGEVRDRFLIDSGDLLFAWSGTPGTSFGAHVWNGGPAVLNQHIFHVKFDREHLDREFFRHAINQKLNELIAKAHGGVGLRHVTKGKFEETKIALPPLPEQRRIVRKIDTLSARTAAARTHLTAIAKLVERYKKGIYDHHFAKAEDRVPLYSLAKVGTGATPKKGNPRYYENGSVPWVTSGAVNAKTVLEPSDYITETALKETNCKLFPAGSLMMAMYGEGKTRGQVARLGIEAATNQALAVIHEIDTDKVDADYLYRFLDSIYLEIREMAEGGVQPNLSLGKVKAFELPLPTLDEQHETVLQIETAYAKIDRLAAEAEKALKLTYRLDQRILAKAFAGELVPQDPDDEPAEELLKRIQQERADMPKSKRQIRKPKTVKTKADLASLLGNWPSTGMTFEELRDKTSGTYEQVKEELFDLLAGETPKLRQEFDTQEQKMRLKKTKT